MPADGERIGFILVFYADCSARTSISGYDSQAIDARNATLAVQTYRKHTKGVQSMEAGNETAAAILVQTIFLKDGHLQGLLGEQATKSPVAAAEFLQPFYRAVLAMVSRAKAEDKS